MGSPRYAIAKGREACRLVIPEWHRHGFTDVETRSLKGAGADLGDLTGHPGIVTQVKWRNTPRVPEWLRETEQQRQRAGAWVASLWVRLTGKPRVEDVQVWLTEPWMADLQNACGYTVPAHYETFRGCDPAWLTAPHHYLAALAAAEGITAPTPTEETA